MTYNVKIFLTILLRRYHNIPCNRYASYVEYFAVFIVLQALFYIVLQVDWIIDDHGKDIGSMVDMMWLIYEYIAGLTLLTVSVAIDSLTKLRTKD